MDRPRKQYNVQLDDKDVERIDGLAEQRKMTRTQLMRNLILIGLDDAEMLQKTGVLTFAEFSKDFMVKVKEAAIKGRLALDKKGELKLNK